MRVAFASDRPRRLLEDPRYAQKVLGADIAQAYRKKLRLIEAVDSEHSLRAFGSLHLEQLKGDRLGTSSIRLNRQWRILLRFQADGKGRMAVIIDVTEYH